MLTTPQAPVGGHAAAPRSEVASGREAGGPRRSPSRPQLVALACLVVLTALGWAYLGLMIASHAGHAGHAGSLGPGMGVIDRLLGEADLAPATRALIDALCRPSFGTAPLAATLSEAVLVIAMWVAMVLAMMLPTAAPMVMAYADRAEAARKRGETAASPLAVLSGYLAVWLAIAVIAALVQVVLARLALIDSAMATASPLFAGAIFIAAGAYQFSALKQSCALRCRTPELDFDDHWTADTWGVVRLGLAQGRACVGCCWVMMLLMFAVGTMNVVWMAGLGAIMAAEKIAETGKFSRAIGVAFAAIGAAIVVTAVIGHWPTHAH
jgi:predicted metal-binding membrane protein